MIYYKTHFAKKKKKKQQIKQNKTKQKQKKQKLISSNLLIKDITHK